MLSGPRKPRRTAIFISGGGSTLQALLEIHHQIDISLIVTNKKNAPGILKAKRFGKQVVYFSREMNYGALDNILRKNKIEFVILAGFMKLLPPEFVELWKNRIMNIHPSLLPKYPGLNSAEKSWNENSEMGVTLHRVIAEMDSGEVLLQQKSLTHSKNLNLDEALLFLRRTEQFLLREFTVRYF